MKLSRTPFYHNQSHTVGENNIDSPKMLNCFGAILNGSFVLIVITIPILQ